MNDIATQETIAVATAAAAADVTTDRVATVRPQVRTAEAAGMLWPSLQKGTETAGTPMEHTRWKTAYEYGSKAGVVLGYTWGEDGRDLVRFRADDGEIIDLAPHMLFPETPASETDETRPDAETRAAWDQVRGLELKARIAAENRHQQEMPEHAKRNTKAGRRRFDVLLELARRLRNRNPRALTTAIETMNHAIGDLVAWTAGGHQLVGELLGVDGEMAMVARLVSGSGIRPEQRKVRLDRLRPATAEGSEAAAVAAHNKFAAQQQKWLDYHDTQFETYIPSTTPDASYAKDFTLTSEAMLRDGHAQVVPDGLIGSGRGQVYVERIENRFGKVVELRGYSVEPEATWVFITRPSLPGQLPRYGTVIQGQDGKAYVVREQHIWRIMSQLSPGERVRLKSTGEEGVIKGDSNRRSHGAIVYSLVSGWLVQSLEVERIDTDGDQVVALEQPINDEETGMYAHNPYQADTAQMEVDPEMHYRTEVSGGPTVKDLCPPGTIVATNYATGPYVVRTVSDHMWKGKRSWGLTCSQLGAKMADSYLNNYVAINGRIRHLFGNNSDEVLILERPEDTEMNKMLRTKKGEVGANQGGAHFAPSQGEWHQMPGRYASINAQIGVLELEDETWLSHPEGWWRWSRRFESRDAALRFAIAKVLRRYRKRFRDNSDGTRYLHMNVSFAELQAVTTWALGLADRKPPKLYTYDPKSGISDVGNEAGEGTMAPKFKFAKDEAVHYKGDLCYWIGRKVGSFRVLASIPGSESGFLVPESEVGVTVFPAPNESGVFDKKHASVIEFKKDKNFYVKIYLLQIAEDAWTMAHDIQWRDGGGAHAPLRERRALPSFEAAMKAELVPMVAGLAAAAAGNPGSNWEGIKPAVAKKAILALLSQIPSRLATDIIIEARSRAGEDRG